MCKTRASIRIVLSQTTHPGNIGGVARAMKTMGLDELSLVSPREFPHLEAERRAVGAVDVLQKANVYSNLPDALTDCVYVVGTTSRERSIEWPNLSPRAAAHKLLEHKRQGNVAVLFGTERTGLTNTEIEYCHDLVRIPTNPDYASLNLASAVQIIAYELRIQSEPVPNQGGRDANDPIATAKDMQMFYAHLEQTLVQIGFVKTTHPPLKLMRKLIRLFNRIRPSLEEMSILRGILTAIQEFNGGTPGDPGANDSNRSKQ